MAIHNSHRRPSTHDVGVSRLMSFVNSEQTSVKYPKFPFLSGWKQRSNSLMYFLTSSCARAKCSTSSKFTDLKFTGTVAPVSGMVGSDDELEGPAQLRGSDWSPLWEGAAPLDDDECRLSF